ncbi:colanic acid biosynthesis glycosyltransferase WcaL [Sulfitobacter alexandrii]|uniref:Colanic acid biosynthesis glycosyltransferase WcaL n=1 Tax=Sulfitobacter alexandrii TaxID=1917485 RepID=A0A1J0WMC5_9RHOB|nr:glycosyltransferase [Sulfitobacter alexandrii]APE45318.1 colanic acid biosynthesis glycosyltransferase WcaL [Sulfitobacter alexandrii]
MKIAYVLNTYPQPSQSFIRREIRALERQGHEVTRIAMRPHDGRLVDTQDRHEADRTDYVLSKGASTLAGAALRALGRAPAAFVAAMRVAWQMGRVSEVGRLRHLIYLAEAAQVAHQCRAAGIDHVHAHFGTNAAAVAMLSRMLGGPAYSFTVHGPEEFDAPRALSLGMKMRRAAFTVAVSHFGRSQLMRWADPAGWDRIHVVHCGIEPARFANPVPLQGGPRRVVAIGRLVEQKGQLALVQAMAQVTADLHLTLLGDGEMRGQIEALIADLDLGARVTLTGWVDEARVNAELAASHALVMPSFAEGLPMVVMEAMAAARPVIATYIAGTPELVRPDETGWLVPAGDVAALARAMEDLAEAPHDRLCRMADAGRARALERHDIDIEAAKLAGHMTAAKD